MFENIENLSARFNGDNPFGIGVIVIERSNRGIQLMTPSVPFTPPQIRRHVVITGTGRAGTTFLVELLTRCGLDTGFDEQTLSASKDPIAHAGLEIDLRDNAAPYIVKSPWFCDYADQVLQRRDILVEHVLIPMRDLYEAAESRRYAERRQMAQIQPVKRLWRLLRGGPRNRTLAGGLWLTARTETQEAALLDRIYQLLYALSNRNTPVTLLQFPRIATDSAFLYRKLKFLLGDMNFPEFDRIHRRTTRQDLINRFATAEPAAQQCLVG